MLEREYPWCPPDRIAVYSREPESDERAFLHVTINDRLVEHAGLTFEVIEA